LISERGAGAYVNALISGLTKIKIPSNLSLVVIVPMKCKPNLSKLKHMKIVQRPFINKILWDFILLPIYCRWEGGCLLHNTENTGGFFLPMLFGFQTCVTIHDVSFLKPFDIVSNPSSIKQWIGLFYRLLSIFNVAKKSKIIFTVSNFAKKDIIREIGVSSKKIIVTYNSISSEFFMPRIFAQKKIIILVTGRSNQKNFDFTLKCLEQNKDILKKWKVCVIGVTGKSTKFIHYVGVVNRKDLIKYYDKASILIMPSLYESFSIPLIEALSRGLTVISSNKGAPPEILKGFGLLYNPRSCEQLREKLLQAFHIHRDKKLSNYKKDVLYALSFTEKKLAKKTLSSYVNIISSR